MSSAKNNSIRLPAEWEPQSAILFTLPPWESDWKDSWEAAMLCFAECISAVSRTQKVVVVCGDREIAISFLGGAVHSNILFFEIPANDSWARDHGPITVYKNGAPLALDFIFNGWGGKFLADLDNQINKALLTKGLFDNISFHSVDMVLEGGSIESDGMGTILTTSNCLLSPTRNPKLYKTAIEDQLKQHLGAKRVLWLDHGHLQGDDTDSHIDTLARFCDPSTIAFVQCRDESDEHYESLQAMENQLRSFRQENGEPYTLVPLPLPTAQFANDGHRLPATYANFLITNHSVLLPVYGDLENDHLAKKQLEKCFPKREIISIDCRVLIEQHGSLHCISMQLPKGII